MPPEAGVGDTLRAQLDALAAHVRDPSAAPPPGVEPRRLAIYRDLFRRNIDRLLASGFPVIRRTLDDGNWQALVTGFLRDHASTTPLFTEVAHEFVGYLQALPAPPQPWLAELAHYEWVELALQLSEAQAVVDGAAPSADGERALLDAAPVLSPLAWPLAYAWPVHMIGPGYRPDAPTPEPTLLLLHRDGAGVVHFHALSPLAWRLLQRLDAAPTDSGRGHLQALAAEAGFADLDAQVDDGLAMLRRWRQAGIVTGTRAAHAP